MDKRVLVRIPAGNGLRADRFFTVDMETAADMIDQGAADDRSWYAGAHVVRDKDDYRRYGYKECDLNGVVRDDEATHMTRHIHDKLMKSKRKLDLSDETEGSMAEKFAIMEEQLNQLLAERELSDKQLLSQANADNRARNADIAAVQNSSSQEGQQTQE